jgi:spermidine synthase
MTEAVYEENRSSEEPSVEEENPPTGAERREALTLLACIFIIAACTLVYELLIATVSSYLLGSSVTQFSLSIGAFLGAMGLGSHLSQLIRRSLLGYFVLIETTLAVLGGMSVSLLFWTYYATPFYSVTLYTLILAIGTLIGLELPILTRLLRQYGSLRTIIAQALSFDYVGSLIGSILFPLLLLPYLGKTRTAFVIGLLNLSVAMWTVYVFRAKLRGRVALFAMGGGVGAILITGLVFSQRLGSLMEQHLYQDDIIYSAQTPYQRIILTRWRDDLRLYLDGNLQFSSTDEYRYHEALIHPAMSLPPKVESVLVLGGGDGLAARELLKYPQVKRILLIDIDPQMTRLGKTYPAIVELNKNALNDPRVQIVNMDAQKFLERDSRLYDLIVADLPDPNNDDLAKLYSVEFFRLVQHRLSAAGVMVTQATSPFFAREAFWCIVKTIEATGLKTAPYHAYVPSFGDWGFVLASARPIDRRRIRVQVPTRYLTAATLPAMFTFSKDVDEIPVNASTLDRAVILDYYLDQWKRWGE